MVQRRNATSSRAPTRDPGRCRRGWTPARKQRNTPHNAAQDSGSEAGMTRERGGGEDGRDVACSVSNGGKTAAMAAGTAQTARLRRHPVLRHGTLGGAGEDDNGTT